MRKEGRARDFPTCGYQKICSTTAFANDRGHTNEPRGGERSEPQSIGGADADKH